MEGWAAVRMEGETRGRPEEDVAVPGEEALGGE